MNGTGGNLPLAEKLANVLGYELDLIFRGFEGGFVSTPAKPVDLALSA